MKKQRILIVDDLKEGRLILTAMIRNNTPYEVSLASDGKSVIENIERIQPDLILLDVMMPEMDGIEVAHRLKKMPKVQDIPIIFITVIDSVDDKVKAFDAGGIDYITKPYNQKEVLSRIRVHLELKQHYDLVQKLNDDINYELEIAREIQNTILNINRNNFKHMNINYKYHPFGQISGDFLDIVSLAENRYLIFIADITGHGIPAALYTMMLKLMLNHIKESGGEAGSIMKQINNDIYDLLFNDIFITASIALVDFNTMELHYTNAAHTPAFFYQHSNKKIIELINKNLILGYKKMKNDFEVDIYPIVPGDKLFFYTDGIYEVRDKHNKPLGLNYLRNFINENTNLPGSVFNQRLYDLSLKASQNNRFDDDLILMPLSL